MFTGLSLVGLFLVGRWWERRFHYFLGGLSFLNKNINAKTPKGVLFGWFYVTKNLQKAFLWVSFLFLFFVFFVFWAFFWGFYQ